MTKYNNNISEWPHDSQVPLVMCQKITHCVLRYANDKGLDRKMETDDLLQPLYKYACQREAKQSKKMLAWLIPALAGSIVVGNPLPVYAALVTSNLAYTKDIDKNNLSNCNTDRIMNTGERTANVEHTSLLHEDDYDDLSIWIEFISGVREVLLRRSWLENIFLFVIFVLLLFITIIYSIM